MALPTAGMWELVTPPRILAIPVAPALCQSLSQPFSLRQQLRLELLRADPLELGTGVLYGGSARNRHLREVIDIRARAQHAQEVVLQEELLVLPRDAVL